MSNNEQHNRLVTRVHAGDVGASTRPRTVTMRVSSGRNKILPRKSRRALLPGSRSRRSLPAGGGSSDAVETGLVDIDVRLDRLQDRVRRTLGASASLGSLVQQPRASTAAAAGNGALHHHNRYHHHHRRPEGANDYSTAARSKTDLSKIIVVPNDTPTRTAGASLMPSSSSSAPVSASASGSSASIISAVPTPGIFTDARLRQFTDQYEAEVKSFASAALHAEVKLNQLSLLGPLPNKLALAVSLDVLRRLAAVSGRFKHLLSRVHDSLLPHCYLPSTYHEQTHDSRVFQSAHERAIAESATRDILSPPLTPTAPAAVSGETTSRSPGCLRDYLIQQSMFSHAERVDAVNSKLARHLAGMQGDRMSSIQHLTDAQKCNLVWDALTSQEPFEKTHLTTAVARDPRQALLSIWDSLRRDSDPSVASEHLRALLFKSRFGTKDDARVADANADFRDRVVAGLWNKNAASAERRARSGSIDSAGSGTPAGSATDSTAVDDDDDCAFQVDENMVSWLLKPEHTRKCTKVVKMLSANVDNAQMMVTDMGGASDEERRNLQVRTLEQYLLRANDEDINVLRTMVLTWDHQNGIEWQLMTKAERQAEKAEQ